MIPIEIPDDGFRVTELGSYRWRVNAEHEARSIAAIRRRWRRESTIESKARAA